VREGCVAVRDVTVEDTDLYPYQVNVLTVPLTNKCDGSRNVTVEVNPSGGFHVLGEATVDLKLDTARNLTFQFYPSHAVAGISIVRVAALDMTDDRPTMTGGEAKLYVANPLRQWWYLAAAIGLVVGYVKRRWFALQLEPSPIPLALGSWFIYRSYLMITRNDMVGDLLMDGGTIPLETVGYFELLALGTVLIVLGRRTVSVFYREPLPLLIALFIFVQLFPAQMYLPDGVAAAGASRSLRPLREAVLVVLAPPVLVLEEVFRSLPFRGLSPAVMLVPAVPVTLLYWWVVARYVCRRIEDGGGGLRGLVALLDLDAAAISDNEDDAPHVADA